MCPVGQNESATPKWVLLAIDVCRGQLADAACATFVQLTIGQHVVTLFVCAASSK